MGKNEAIRAFQELLSLLEPYRIRHRGLLGLPGQADPQVNDRPNYVWFQEDGNPSKARQIFNMKVPAITDLPVVTGEDSNNPGFEQVLDVDIGMLPRWLDRSFVQEHHLTHELGATDSTGNRIDSDVVYIQKGQFVALSARAQSTPDMTLYIEPDFYMYGTIRKYWGGGSTKTFSAPTTDGYAAFEVICIDGITNTLVYVRGPDFPAAVAKDYTLIPEPPLGSTAVAAAYLPHGTTSLNYENIADVRMFLSTLGGSITGMAHRHTSEFDGGYLSSGLSITGDLLLYRASDQAILGRYYGELGEIHLNGKISITGDAVISGGSITLSNAIGARAWRTDAHIISSDVWVSMSFDTEEYDVGGCYALGDPTKFYGAKPGFFSMSASCVFGIISGSGVCRVSILKNGATYLATQAVPLSTTENSRVNVSDNMVYLGTTDYIEFIILQSTNCPISTVSAGDDISNQFRYSGSIVRNA